MHRCASVTPASMQVHRLCKSNLVVIFPSYCSETNVTYSRQISEHLPRDTQKSQDLYCSLFPEELTHGVALITCTKDSLYFREAAVTFLPQSWEQAGPASSRQNLHNDTPKQHKKSDTSSSECAETCGCLLAVTTQKLSLGFYASWICLDQGKGNSAR